MTAADAPLSVRFFYDFVSPYTYLATTRLDAMEATGRVRFTWEPAFLAAVMKATGNQPPAALAARARYMGVDLARWATHYGVPFRFSPHFPVASQHALRAALAVREAAPDRYRAFVDAVFRATWVDGEDTSDRAVLASIATRVGAPADLARDASDEARWKDALRASTEAAVAAGAFGLPAFVVGDSELYFGNDRLPLLEQRIARGAPFPTLDIAAPKVGLIP